ncbi:MAG: SLC26A/SulP transporter family protein [Proteobacteria bacterium]|nr:SLC26A/SulP transporter family protein [Pseudomonadota bacterium]
MKDWPQLKGDLLGGAIATVVALPPSMAFGAIAFAPLGAAYVPLGVLGGLLATTLSNLGAAGFRGVPILVNAPSSLAALMLASCLNTLLHPVAASTAPAPAEALALLMFVVLMAGAFQAALGAAKLGDLIKYIPHPVIAGLVNGTALLIVLGQLRPMFGMSSTDGWSLSRLLTQAPPVALWIGLFTLVAVLLSRRLTQRVPAPLVGLSLGTLLHHALRLTPLSGRLGPVIGRLPGGVPWPRYLLPIGRALLSPGFPVLAPQLLGRALGIAVAVSLQSLIGLVAADQQLPQRSSTRRELIGQGTGNMLAALFGGVACDGNALRALTNYRYGGRTWLSRWVAGLCALGLLLLGPVMAWVPRVVLAGMLAGIALGSFDAWSLGVGRHLLSRDRRPREVIADLGIVGIVMAVFVALGVFQAVVAGVLIAVVLFVYRMGRDVVRREYSAERIRSHIERRLGEIAVLEREGRRIRVFELQGALFFGTADKLAARIEGMVDRDLRFIIVNLKRVSELDSTGGHLLLQIRRRCRQRGIALLLCSTSGAAGQQLVASELGSREVAGDGELFASIDDALGWAEDRLLDQQLGADRYAQELPLREVDCLDHLSAEELALLGQHLVRRSFAPGERILTQGEAGDALHALVQGRAEVRVQLAATEPERSLRLLCPGTLFGEMALLDQALRSASVVALDPVVALSLTHAALAALRQDHPELAYKLMLGIGRELAKRVRIANRIATELRG